VSIRAVIMRHALPNGLIPVLTFMGLQVTALLGGSVIIESIFTLPGLGTLTVGAIQTKDYQHACSSLGCWSSRSTCSWTLRTDSSTRA
jgi:ABC-type dipeptide/oligopeptide/nickel transport system permease component